MRTLEMNDWVLMNSIIYKIYTIEDQDDMRRELLEQMKMLLDYDSADFYLASQEENQALTDPVMYNCDEEVSAIYDKIDYSRGILYSGKCMVYRETDIMPDEKRVQTEYYNKVYRPNRWHYSLQMILAKNKQFLGVMTLYRTIGKDNFQYDDIFLLDMLKEHLAYRLYDNLEAQRETEEKLTITQATKQYGLTRQEHKILQMLLTGLDNQEVCEELSITINTLKKHIFNIYRKLNVRNRVQLFKMVSEKE